MDVCLIYINWHIHRNDSNEFWCFSFHFSISNSGRLFHFGPNLWEIPAGKKCTNKNCFFSILSHSAFKQWISIILMIDNWYSDQTLWWKKNIYNVINSFTIVNRKNLIPSSSDSSQKKKFCFNLFQYTVHLYSFNSISHCFINFIRNFLQSQSKNWRGW